MAIRVNFTVPADLLTRLKESVRDRQRSHFVAEAIQEKLARLEEEKLDAELAEGYRVRAEEGAAVNAEWEAITLEGWPEYEEDDEQ